MRTTASLSVSLYTLNFVDKSTDDLINETINDLDIPENHKRLIRSLPDELNVFYRDGVSQYSIDKLEAVSKISSRVNTSTNAFDGFSQNEINNIIQHSFALATVVDYNIDTVFYSASDFQKVAEGLVNVSNEELRGKDFEPFYEQNDDVPCLEKETAAIGFNIICIDGVGYRASDLGNEYFSFVRENKGFDSRIKGENVAVKAIVDKFGSYVKSFDEMSDAEFSDFFYEPLTHTSLSHRTGAGFYFGNLDNNSNVEHGNGTNFNVHNIGKKIVGDASTHQGVAERILESSDDSLDHFTGLPYLNRINWPRPDPSQVKEFNDAYETFSEVTNISWIPSVVYSLPKSLGGISSASSPIFSGVFANLLLGQQVPAIQLDLRQDLEVKDAVIYARRRPNITRIDSDFNNDGVIEKIFVNGNTPLGKDFGHVCKALVPLNDLIDYLYSDQSISVFRTSTTYCSNN